jgi:uroporphyrinogen decarboxylase
VAGSVGHTYETSWQIRGYEEFLTDLMLRPAMAEALLDRIANRNCLTATATARAGVDYLRLGDDVASQRSLMFPPEIWRRVFKPRLAKIIEAGRREKPDLDVWYHSDGNIWEIIPDLIEVGVTILNPIQPECMDPVKLQREYGRDLVLDGTIGTQSVMPFGTPEDVTETVRQNIEQLGQAGGLILSPTHVLEPEVPIVNIEAFFAACDTYGNG